MKINGNEIRQGNIIEHNNKLYRVVKVNAVKPGKGGAYAQVELKDIISGSKLNERFRASESVKKVRLEQKEYQFLFADGDILTFMDLENYEQINVNLDSILKEQQSFLEEGLKVEVEFYEGQALSVSLPEHMILEVDEADAVVKGQTASSSYKPAKLINGVKILVPPYISVGDKIKVDTIEHKYLERVNK